MALDYSKAYLTPSKIRESFKLKAERDAVMLATVENLLPLPKNATFEELVEISQKVGGNNAYYSRIDKAIKAHPAYKKVLADLNTGELGRNYAYLKRPETTISIVNRTYKEVKKREGIAKKALDAVYKRAGNDPVKLIEEYNKVGAKNITVPLEKKIRSLPAYKEFLGYDKAGFAKQGTVLAKSKNPSREFLRFKTYLQFVDTLPEGTKLGDYIPLRELVKDLGKSSIPTPKRLGTGADAARYRFFDYNQITKLLGNSIVAKDGREFFRKPTNEQITKLRRFFKDGTYMYGDHTESVVKAIHQNPKLQKLLAAKKFPELHEFKPELEKVLGGGGNKYVQLTDAQVANGTRIYSDWTKGTMFKNMGFEFKPLASEVALGNRIYDALEGFKRNNAWAQGEYLHAMRQIRANMPKEAGTLESFKSMMYKYLPDKFLSKKNLNINEIFSIKQSARNKAFPYAYFVDVIDADINVRNLANFQGKLSSTVADTRNLISRLRAGDKTVSYGDITDRIKRFQSERATHAETIKRNFPGKNVNIADIVLGSEKEILKGDFNIADRVYSAKLLDKWKKQGIDIASHAKTEGFAMTGANKQTAFLFRDLVNVSKELWKKGSSAQQYEVAFKLKCVGFNASGGRIGFALGSGAINCVNTKITNQPLESSRALSTIEEGATGVLGRIGNTARGFLGAVGKWGPKVGKYGAIMAAGAIAQPLVKQFRNDDVSTYLTDPDQQAGMLEALIEGKREKPRSEILDWGIGAGQVGATAAAVPGSGALYKFRRGLSEAKIPKAGPVSEAGLTAGDYISRHTEKLLGRKKGLPQYGKIRAGAGVGMKLLSGMFTPAGLLATEPLRIAQKRREGESWGDIATDPFTWMGPAFAPSMTKMATRGMKAGSLLPRLLRLGISRGALAAMGPIGWAGLAASLGWEGYKQYKDYKKHRGFFASEDRI